MERSTSVQSLLERLAILDQQIETLQARIVAMQQRPTKLPTVDLEQALMTLVVARATYRARVEQMQRHGGIDRDAGESARDGSRV